MSYIYTNPNPKGKMVGDCVVRAVAIAMDMPWNEAYMCLVTQGLKDKDMPSANSVLGAYLSSVGFNRYTLPNTCPHCYTVEDFCREHYHGVYILATGTHVVAAIDGDYYDAWNSGNEVPIYYWRKEK